MLNKYFVEVEETQAILYYFATAENVQYYKYSFNNMNSSSNKIDSWNNIFFLNNLPIDLSKVRNNLR